MPKQGGYQRSSRDEWVKTSRSLYGTAIRSAEEMGLELEVWLSDAIQFHAYRCEAQLGREQYAQDYELAKAQRRPSPLADDYKPKGPMPQMSQPGAGQGSGPGRSYRR